MRNTATGSSSSCLWATTETEGGRHTHNTSADTDLPAGRPLPLEPIERILAKHFGIDLNKLENEKREILAGLADLND